MMAPKFSDPIATDGRRQGRGRADRRQRDAGRPRQEPPRRGDDRRGRKHCERGPAWRAPMTRWLLRIFSVLALAGFSAVVWFAGPLIRFADTRPLEPVWLRDGDHRRRSWRSWRCFYGLRFWRARKAQKALETAVARNDDRDDDSQVLEARMNEAHRHAEAVERQAQLSLRTPLVHHHRPARRRQDNGAGQFRA